MENGEFVFLIGKSGSGKSTFLQMIYMNQFPESGYIQLLDYDSNSIKKNQLPELRKKLGIIFQEFRLIQDRSIYDNLAFILEVTNTPSREIKKRVNAVLNDVGLSHKKKCIPSELSGGEQQRVAIARAIINEPSLILADEPTGNLDPETSFEILELIKKINTKGAAILFATHNYEIVKKFDARIVKIENNKVLNAVIKKKNSNEP
jgi:cell division transport system ATP-binding protein